jgi:hypothetical protein
MNVTLIRIVQRVTSVHLWTVDPMRIVSVAVVYVNPFAHRLCVICIVRMGLQEMREGVRYANAMNLLSNV